MPLYNPPLPKLLFKSNIPFIIPSSGSMGDNGALTVTTTLTFIYPKAYVYLPASAIVAGSAAGWYYTVFGSATVGQVFNNLYDPAVGGEPTVPASPTAFVTTGPGAYTQDVAAGRQGPSFTLSAGTLSASGRLWFEFGARCNNTANAKSVSLRQSTTVLTTATLTSQTGINLMAYLEALGATNSQVVGTYTSIAGGTFNSPPSVFTFNFANALGFNVFPLTSVATDNMVVAFVRVWQEA
jgi:hypothetical protein